MTEGLTNGHTPEVAPSQGLRFSTPNEMQGVIVWWQNEIYDPEECTPQARFLRALEEVEEGVRAMEALDGTPERMKAFVEEVGDAIIGLIGSLGAAGFDIETVVGAKLDTMYRKYNPVHHNGLKANGMSSEEAMAHSKETWKNGTHPLAVTSNGYVLED